MAINSMHKWMFYLLSAQLIIAHYPGNAQSKIDRMALVRRHNVVVSSFDSLASLSVGNGHFAYTMDITGMQSFPDACAKGVPLGTESEWGWHSFPNSEGLRIEQAEKLYELEGRKISYAVQPKEPASARQAADYFRVNQHRLQLGNIGLEMQKQDGSAAGLGDIKNMHQELDCWTGLVTSSFTLEGIPVKIITSCHQHADAIAFSIKSHLIEEKRLRVRIRFPYPNGQFRDGGDYWYDGEDKQQSDLSPLAQGALIRRTLDTTTYFAALRWTGKAVLKKKAGNYFLLTPGAGQDSLELTAGFSPGRPGPLPAVPETMASSRQEWKKFWLSGGAVDFTGSTDPRAFEIERRVVLSQYLTKLQCASSFPPQETGLTYNSWYGKPHLEMHWWHAVHYAQWGRPGLLESSLNWYFTAYEKAKALAKRQGFEGVRWQKMTDHAGNESPSSVGAFLIWQQPHLIYMAEMLYRSGHSKKVLDKYKKLVFATAEFMASFPSFQSDTKKYNLGKGLIPAQECFDAVKTFNPTYELAYWSWALGIAQQWRLREGLQRNRKWDDIIDSLAPLPQANGVYLATASTPDCYTTERYLTDHPAVLGAYASLPATHGLDTIVMKNTFELVWKIWHWNDTWGWDFPLTAMTATRLHMPDKAVEALLMPIRTNTYLASGHNYQDERLTIYLPGNGGVLNAVALMCTGADADKSANPGFPANGQWKVRWEGLAKLP